MFKISFDFNPASQQVSNIIVTPTLANQAKDSNNPIIIVDGSTIRFSQAVLDELGVAIGDKLCIRFNAEGDKAIIATPLAVSEPNGGNLITKQLSIACRGASKKAIDALGSQFTWSKLRTGAIELTPLTSSLLGNSNGVEELTKQLLTGSDTDKPAQQDPINAKQDELELEIANNIELPGEFNFDFTIK